MPADGRSNVIDITDLVGGRADRDLRRALGVLRTGVVDPPPELLPTVLARLDDGHRFPWFAPTRNTRWAAYAGGFAAGAAGAVMLASRSKRAG